MPELSNIQTFEKIDGSNFRPTLDRFRNVLKNIGLWNEEIKNTFDNFKWSVEDDGFVYSSITQLGHFKSRLSNIKIRPLVMVYTAAIDTPIEDNWISCELLILSEELRSFDDGKFYRHTYELVKALTFEMQKEFNKTGIYFTDEAQDGSDFSAIRHHDATKLWQFDYALIPNNLDKFYSDKPKTHEILKQEKYNEAWLVERWTEKPYS